MESLHQTQCDSRQTITTVGNRPRIGAPKSRTSRRFVHLPPDAIEVLAQHKRQQDAQRQIVGRAWAHPELVFPSEVGSLMHPRNFTRDWSRAVRDAGVPHARVHDMRHLHISLLILHGDDPKTVSERAGHASTAFTLDRYGHVFKQQRQRAARSLGTLLRPAHSHAPNTTMADEGVDADLDDQPNEADQ